MTSSVWSRWLPRVPIGVLVLVGLLLPFTVSDTRLDTLVRWMPFALAALGLNLLTGFNGQISLGHGAFFGFGAYACALLVTELGWSFPLAVLGAVVLSFGLGVALGVPALRITGLYLALVTLLCAVLFPELVKQTASLTGGPSGLKILGAAELNARGVKVARLDRIDPPSWVSLTRSQWTFLLFLAVTVVAFLVVRNVTSSRIGRAMVAIRDSEVAALVNGVHVARVKVVTFGWSAALAGLGGALFALSESQVYPQAFMFSLSLTFLVMVVVGGSASVSGAAFGAVVVGMSQDLLAPDLPERLSRATPLMLGAGVVLAMVFAPGGLSGIARQLLERVQGSRGGRSTAPQFETVTEGSPRIKGDL